MQTKLFIGGEFVDGLAGGTIEVLNPFDGSKLADGRRGPRRGRRSRGRRRRARRVPGVEPDRGGASAGRLLFALSSAVEGSAARLAELESRDTGHPIPRLGQPRRAAHGPRVPLLSPAWPTRSRGSVIPVDPGFLNYRRARAARRGRPDRAVETSR